jgi:hypothetical protein
MFPPAVGGWLHNFNQSVGSIGMVTEVRPAPPGCHHQ